MPGLLSDLLSGNSGEPSADKSKLSLSLMLWLNGDRKLVTVYRVTVVLTGDPGNIETSVGPSYTLRGHLRFSRAF